MPYSTIYQEIGGGYAARRQADAHWQRQIHDAIGITNSLINIGAGTGSYEPDTMYVVAVEPSTKMIRQRPPHAAPVVQSTAEQLPFAEGAFDVALAILTTHHWSEPDKGLAEMRRVSARQAVVTWDPAVFAEQFWLVAD